MWRERVLAELQSSAQVTLLILQNEVVRFLTQLADSLRDTNHRNSYRIEQERLEALHFARAHGSNRAASVFYTLADMVHEFHVLRQVVFEVLEELRPCSIDERNILLDAFESAVNSASSKFAETQLQYQEHFMLTLAHDLRNPIAAAKMNAQLISRTQNVPEDVARRAQTINVKMDRLESMLREFLDVSRSRAGEDMVLHMQEVRLDLLARDVADELALTHGTRFRVVADHPVTGECNPGGVRRVIENLAVNAVKYGKPDTPVTITVTEDAERVTISVHNEGEPIPAEEQPKLFERYHRRKTAVTQTGWGLGLALVLAMTNAHHGKVHIDSTRETGTRFIVELPKSSPALAKFKAVTSPRE